MSNLSQRAPGLTALLMGPPGSGKSTFARTALAAEGSGLICLAPGADEWASYTDFEEKGDEPRWEPDGGLSVPEAPYLFAPFDDDDYLPTLDGARNASAQSFKRALRFLRACGTLLQEDRAAGRPPRWKVLVTDTFTGFGQLCYNAKLAEMKLVDPPAAISPEGATFYGGIRSKMHEMSRVCRALRGLGMHWVATAHTFKRDVDKDSYGAQDKISSAQVLPVFSGSFREQVGGIFDLNLFTGIDRDGNYVMQWSPDMKKNAKSRYGSLADTPEIGNTWQALQDAIAKAERPV